MPARRFFVEGVRAPGARVEIGGSDAHKIAHVLRLRDGDRIEIVDSAGSLFVASVAVDGTVVRATLIEALAGEGGATSSDEHRLRIDVAQGVPKGSKMDLIVEKCTELGAAAVLPFYSERTVVHDLGAAKLERWRRVAKSAAQQSGRLSIPEIHEPAPSFDSLLARFSEYDAVLFPWELAPHERLLDRLPNLLSGASRALVVIGPEGGFSHREAEAAQAHGATLLWLGSRILRTETAALALLAVIDAVVSV